MPVIDSKVDPVTVVYQLKSESNSDREIYHEAWARSKRRYGTSHYDVTANEGQSQYVINMTRNAVNNSLALITETPPDISISPMETDAPGMYYLKTEIGTSIAATLTRIANGEVEVPEDQVPSAAIAVMNTLTEEQIVGDEPILPQQFDALKKSTNPLTGSPFLDDTGVYRFDDITVADLLERSVRGVWNKYDWDRKTQDFELDALVIGHRDVIVEYDEDIEDVRISPILEKDSWIDPNPSVKDISDASYYIIGQVMSAEMAIKRFPNKKDAILRNIEDPGSATAGNGEPLSERYTDIDWERDMVVLYTCWIRDQELTIDGKKTRGLREIRIVGSELLFDGPSKYDDIPAVRFKFITIIDSSYSVGMPEILKDPQEVLNRLFSNMSDHTRFLAHPMAWMVEEVAEILQNKGATFNRSNDPITVPLALMEELRRDPVNFVDTPSINPSHISLLSITMSIFHDIASQSDVNRGFANSAARSGVAVEALQNAGNRTLGLASKWMDQALARLNTLTYRWNVKFMPPNKWHKYVDKYPINVLSDMIKRAGEAEFNVRVETSGTKNIKRQAKQQKALLMRENSAISLQTFLKDMEIDNPEQEAQRIIEEQSAIARAQTESQSQASLEQTENQAKLDTVKTQNQIELEKAKAVLEGEIEVLKAQLVSNQNDGKENKDQKKS